MNFPSLRDYQTNTVHLAHGAIAAGHRNVCVVGPTGMGKRRLLAWWCAKAISQGKRVLIATDRRMLVNQMADELRDFGVPHGVIMGARAQQIEYPVQVASIQTLKRRGLLDGEPGLPDAELVMVDEAHKDPVTYKKLFQCYPQAIHMGMTATPVCSKGKLLDSNYFSQVVEGCKNSELIRDGWLLPTTVICPSEPEITGVVINNGEEFNQSTLSKAVWSVTSFANVFDEWLPFTDHQTIAFVPGLAYARGLAEGPGDSFKARGIKAVVIEADMKPAERERAFNAFKAREIRVLISVDILKEGSDFPIASCAIDLQPNAQLRTFWQKCGRIKRIFAGQDRAIYLDMAGNLWRHYIHPDDDPDWFSLTGDQTTAELTLRKKKDSISPEPKEPKLIVCPKCGESRKGGPKCPNCGHEYDKQVKHIRMGDGKLKEVSAAHVEKRQKTALEQKASAWMSALFQGLNSGKTIAQCKYLYKVKTGESVPDGLPCMPAPHSIDWDLRVDQKYSKGSLGAAYGTWKSRIIKAETVKANNGGDDF